MEWFQYSIILLYVNEIGERRAAGKTRVHSSKLAELHSAPESCSPEHRTPAGISKVWHQWTWLYLVGRLRCYFNHPYCRESLPSCPHTLDYYLRIVFIHLKLSSRLSRVAEQTWILFLRIFFQIFWNSRGCLCSKYPAEYTLGRPISKRILLWFAKGSSSSRLHLEWWFESGPTRSSFSLGIVFLNLVL